MNAFGTLVTCVVSLACFFHVCTAPAAPADLSTDVCIVGGGSGGYSAAIAAARAVSDHSMDVHGAGSRRVRGHLTAPYGIPYRCLIPKDSINLLVAFRRLCFSITESGTVLC